LLGTGYSSINLATDNDFLRALGEVGILGFSAFILILATIGVRWIRFLPRLANLVPIEKAYMAGIMGAFAGVMVNALFIDVFEASKFAIIFWLMIGLSIQLSNE
jgi:O-antigen ligase